MDEMNSKLERIAGELHRIADTLTDIHNEIKNPYDDNFHTLAQNVSDLLYLFNCDNPDGLVNVYADGTSEEGYSVVLNTAKDFDFTK